MRAGKYCFSVFQILLWLSVCAHSLCAQDIPPPSISSFSPASVCPGGSVTITGSNFTGATSIKVGGLEIDPADFKVNSATSITFTLPDGANTGKIQVTTPGGSTTSSGTLQISPVPSPALTHVGAIDPFTNCDGNSTYVLVVGNSSSVNGSGNQYDINWGDGTAHFTQTDWSPGAQTSHTYTAQGYFNITLTITPTNGCTKTKTYRFYNGQNPLASFSTTNPTTGLCVPAPVEFQIGNWANNSAGTVYRINYGDGSSIETLSHPLNSTNGIQTISHTYNSSSCPNIDFTATLQASNGCFTTTYTLNQIIIRKKPEADFDVPAAVCVNTSTCFTNKSVDGFSGNSCNTSTTYVWDFGDGTSSSQENPCHTYATAGTYTVTLTASNVTCGGDMRTKQVTVRSNSPAPVVTNNPEYCQGATAVKLTATGSGLLWYNIASGGTGTSVAPTPSTSTPGKQTYYVSQTIAGNCESDRVPVTVTVYALPGAPAVTTPVSLCQNQSASPLTATGIGLLWYTAATGGTGATTAPTPATTAVGTTSYYVSQTTNGCEGPRTKIDVIVGGPPVAPTVTSPVRYCQGEGSVPLSASGTSLLWYTTATGGTGSANAPLPSTANVGSTSYYVSQAGGCGESPRSEIVVQISARPSATIAYNPSVLCNVTNSGTTPNNPVTVTQTGSTGGRYTISPVAGLPINATTGTLTPSGATAGTYTITYTVPGANGCGDFSTNATVTVSGTPVAVISYPAICSSDGPVKVQLTGTAGGNYSVAVAGLDIDAGTGTIDPAASTPGTYEVTYTIAASPPCPGFKTSAMVTIQQAPAATIAYSPSVLCNVKDQVSTPNPKIAVTHTGTTGGNYSISPAGLSINPATGELTPSEAKEGTYTITYTIPGSGGCAVYTTTTQVTVNSTPIASIGYPAICSSDGPVSPQITGTQGGSFSSSAGLSIDGTTGVIDPAASTPGTYMVNYDIAASAPCPGYSAKVNVTITRAPAATIAYSSSILCNVVHTGSTPNLPVAVTLTGTTGGSFSIAPTGLDIDPATGTIDPSGAVAGTYTITYHITGAGGCADFNTTTSVTVNSTPVATISYAGSPYCGATATAQPVTFAGTTGGRFHAAAGLSIDAATGDINPAASAPGIYEVFYTIDPSAPCPGYEASTQVQIVESPVVNFPQASQEICSGGTAVYTPSSTVANTTYTWSVTGSLPGTVTGVSSGTVSGSGAAISLTFNNSGAASQTLQVQVVPANDGTISCPGASATLTLAIHPIPAAPVTADVDICMHEPVTTLQADATAGNTLHWYDKDGGVLNAAPVIKTTVPDQFLYYVSQSTTHGCESSKAPVNATVHPVAKIVGATYTNPTACGIPSGSIVLEVLDLNGNGIPGIPVTVHYDKFQSSYAMEASTDVAGKITMPLTAGTYSKIYVETSGGCTSQPIPDVFVLKDPDPPAQPVAGYNPPICSETPLTLTALSPTSTEPGDVSYVWAGPAFGPYADTSLNTVVTFPSAPVTYAGTYVVYALQNNCISLASSFEVTILQSPLKPVISTRAPLCVGDNLLLQASSSIPGNLPLEYTWNGPGSGFPVNSTTAGINNVQIEDGGIYSVTVNSPQTGCSVTSDTMIRIGEYPVVRFAQDTLTLPTGYRLKLEPVILNAATPGVLPIENYSWTPADDIDCNDAACSSPIATIKNNTCYNVTATNIYGCSGSDVICVKVFCDDAQVFIPNAFTPRGNIPENTKLVVRATGIATVKSFRVFNRWGKVVFEKNNFPPNSTTYGWDGMVNGRLADTGVYIYTVDVICENGVPYSFKGNVTLL